MCAEALCNDSVASTNEGDHNVWNPLLDALVEYQSGHVVLSSSITRRQPDWVSLPDLLWTSCRCEETSSQQLSVPFAWFSKGMGYVSHPIFFEAETASFPGSLEVAAV